MQTIHEVATLTSKGQITLPKSIRQALGVDVGGKIAFDLEGSDVIVRRVSDLDQEKDPAMLGFLSVLENDIRSGQHVTTLPENLIASMRSILVSGATVDSDITGEVDL
ncbi:MAG: type II toxin-antitoxin system PrlF family antitoxin [Ottowia sp.]|nr:type II toxin-antitoxin system PrlF family antitoxin [Ottowia sp.]